MTTRFVLAIDGGGIRGMIPALVLDHIEQRTGRAIGDMFDLLAGTSTGGILALALGLPGETANQTAAFSAAELVGLYRDRGPEIFSQSFWQRLRSLRGVFDETYSARHLERVLERYFKARTLGDCRVPVMVTAYALERRQAVFLKSFHPDHRPVTCTAAARATSAAPTFFEPANVTIAGAEHALIDGGVFINSPSVSAYAEALSLYPNDDIHVLSLGTGQLTRPIDAQRAAEWGTAGWIVPLLDCMFDGVAKVTDHQMRLLLGSRYWRLQLTLDTASDAMDDVSEDNLRALERAAMALIAREQDRLDRLVAQLREA